VRKLSECFKIIKPIFVKKCFADDDGICYAIQFCGATHRALQDSEITSCRDYIKGLVGDNFYVTKWVETQGFDISTATWAQIKDYRLRWLDHIIATLEAEGR
jgi:hypothetical protein